MTGVHDFLMAFPIIIYLQSRGEIWRLDESLVELEHDYAFTLKRIGLTIIIILALFPLRLGYCLI